ncbi:MAG: gamma-glutamyltransferase [Deltaproteobacteria bacterium]|nr:gamma-glutamyltransferase [Deltaproteobacteria bacterium]
MRNIVVAPQPLAVEAGAEIFDQGGNAIDAAIGAAFVQGVIDPSMTSIGGFGTMLIYSAPSKKMTEIAFHGTVPRRAKPDMFVPLAEEGSAPLATGTYLVKDYANQIGYLACTVPGAVKGLCQAHQDFGSLPLKVILQPAVRLAYEGWRVRPDQWNFWVEPPPPGRLPEIRRFNATPAATAIYSNRGELWKVGEKVLNEDYAHTLEAIAAEGPDAFYKGEIARRIAEDFRKNGGLIDEIDLANYQTVTNPPLSIHYRGHEVHAAGPPAGGLVALEILKILEGFPLGEMVHNSAEYIHLLSQAMRIAFRDLEKYLGDPQFVSIPMELLLSSDYAAQCRMQMVATQGHTGEVEHSNTTQVCTVDAHGNAVSLTHSVGACSGVVVPGLGFLFNGQMHRFNPVAGFPNSIAPGKRRTTGMSPSVIFRDGKLFMVLGAPGGQGIIHGVVQTILNVVDFGLPIREAVSLPRFHSEGKIITLESRIPVKTVRRLEKMGNRVEHSLHSYHRTLSGCVHAIHRDPVSGDWTGAADPRDGGMVLRS